MKKHNFVLKAGVLFISSVIVFSSSCKEPVSESYNGNSESAPAPAATVANPNGIGEIKHVDVSGPINEEMVTRAKSIFEMKCAACHKLNAERLVGPGWLGVTTRRTPEWIMNMITNTDMMLDKDPAAQKLLETCQVRMPNQSLTVADSRDIVEFMRKNDVKK